MKDLQTQKRIKASAFGSAILALVALAFFAGCSVYLLDGSGTIADTGTIDDSDTGADSDTSSDSGTSDSGTSSGSGTSSDSTSSVSYSASDLAGSYTGSSTLNDKLLEIMNNCTDPVWQEWLEKAYSSVIGNLTFTTTAVTSVALTLDAGGSFEMEIIYQSTLTSTLYNQDGELEISGTWSVSGSTVTFNYSTSNVEDDWETTPEAIVGVIGTLVNGAELWTDGSSLYGRFGYGNYWTDTSDTLFTR